MKRWTTIIVATIMLCVLAIACAESTTVYVLVEEGSCLNVRVLPNLSADTVFRMERGEALALQEMQTDGWAKVSRAGDWGYCRIEYLTDTSPEAPTLYETIVGKLRLRKVPGGDTLRKLDKGEQVEVLGFITDTAGTQWARVEQGFILAECLAAKDTSAQ